MQYYPALTAIHRRTFSQESSLPRQANKGTRNGQKVFTYRRPSYHGKHSSRLFKFFPSDKALRRKKRRYSRVEYNSTFRAEVIIGCFLKITVFLPKALASLFNFLLRSISSLAKRSLLKPATLRND